MSRLLVTGATGFVGRPCVRRAQEEFEVHATARTAPAALPSGVRFHPCDLFDPLAVEALLAAVRPTYLLHLAWVATPGLYWTSPDNDRWVGASEYLVRAFFRWGGRRAVVTGTCAEYDWAAGGVCHEIRTPLRPTTLYGRCKFALAARLAATGHAVVWARLFHLYGPGEHPQRLVPSIVRSLLAGVPAACTDGAQRRDFLHTDDLADALVRLTASGLTGPVNIGSGRVVTVREVAETLGRCCGRPDLIRLGARPRPAGDPDVLVPDVTRLRTELGWSPRRTLEEGLRECVAWWEKCRAA